MTTQNSPSATETDLADLIRRLSELTHTLELVVHQLSERAPAGSEERRALDEAGRTLGTLADRLSHGEAEVEATHQRATLRQEVLSALAQRGSMIPIELAAITLSLPEELQPVLEALAQEGLVEVHEGRPGSWVSLTPKGRALVQSQAPAP